MSHGVQGIHHYIVNHYIVNFWLFNNSLMALRKIWDPPPHMNLSAKTKWQKDDFRFNILLFGIPSKIMFPEIKRNLVLISK